MLLKNLSKEYLFDCECKKYTKKTISGYEKSMNYLLSYLEQEFKVATLEELKPQHIKNFLLYMSEKDRTEVYINNLLKVYRCFCKYIFQEEYISYIITSKVKNLKEPKTVISTFTNEQVKRLLQYYNGFDFISIRNKAILALLFDTGVRCNELLTLTYDQIFNDYILIKGKNNKERYISKSPMLTKIFFRYNNMRESFFKYKPVENNVFVSRTGKKLTNESINNFLKEAATACNITENIRVSAHTCRHTFAQMQLKNGLDVYSLSRLMGHESISITQRYLQGLQDKDILISSVKTSPLMNL